MAKKSFKNNPALQFLSAAEEAPAVEPVDAAPVAPNAAAPATPVSGPAGGPSKNARQGSAAAEKRRDSAPLVVDASPGTPAKPKNRKTAVASAAAAGDAKRAGQGEALPLTANAEDIAHTGANAPLSKGALESAGGSPAAGVASTGEAAVLGDVQNGVPSTGATMPIETNGAAAQTKPQNSGGGPDAATAPGGLPARAAVPPGMKPNPAYIETRSKRVQLLMQPSLHARLKALAAGQDISLNDLVHTVLEGFAGHDAE